MSISRTKSRSKDRLTLQSKRYGLTGRAWLRLRGTEVQWIVHLRFQLIERKVSLKLCHFYSFYLTIIISQFSKCMSQQFDYGNIVVPLVRRSVTPTQKLLKYGILNVRQADVDLRKIAIS